MKFILLSCFLTIVHCAIGQPLEKLKTLLKESFPNSSTMDAHWVYFDSEPTVFKSPVIDSLNPNLKLYKVSLTNVTGRHILTNDCLVLLKKKKPAIKLIEPLFYADEIAHLSKLVVGKKAGDSTTFANLITEIQHILEIGGIGHFENVQFSDSMVTFEYVIMRGNIKQIWRKFTIHYSNYTISAITTNKNH